MELIIAKSKKDVWNKYRDEFIKFYIEEANQKRIKNSDLEYRFHDQEGRVYFGFPDTLPMPLERWGKARDFLHWMNNGLSSEEFNELISVAEKNWLSYIKTGKNASKVGYIFEEMKNRSAMTLHTELLYNYLAVQVVREDEDPIKFNNEIHIEKVEQFKKETEAGNHYFFFRQPELKKLHELWNFSQEEWEKYWTESQLKQQLLKKALRTILSEQESRKETKISNEG